MSFANKVVLVTGGSSGIGAATAVAFAKEGADVIIVGRNEHKLQQVASDITKIGKPPLIIKADVTKDEDLKNIIKKTIEKHNKINILVNNAGCLKFGKLMDDNVPEIFDLLVKTNLRSAVLMTNLAAPHLIKVKGNIVNVSSVCADITLSEYGDGYGPYCLTKAGLNHFTRSSASELARHGVRVNSVNPGPVETGILDNDGEKYDWRYVETKTPLRTVTQVGEVANLILFLASDKVLTITGSHFKIDSGITLT